MAELTAVQHIEQAEKHASWVSLDTPEAIALTAIAHALIAIAKTPS